MNIVNSPQIKAIKKFLNENFTSPGNIQMISRPGTHYRSGALKPKPPTMPLGFIGVIGSVLTGLFIGAAISKNVANFLEENELFVVDDDDDDD